MNRYDFLTSVEEAAAYGLLEEVRTTPKPGLVDLNDNGSHRDMCYETFVASTRAIVPGLVQMAAAGYDWEGSEMDLFPAIRPIGAQAEHSMFQATGGVNTHKGMIFSLGIICACLGYLFRDGSRPDPEQVLEFAGRITRDWLEQDFQAMRGRPLRTHGERLFAQYGFRGIRGEAQEGFPNLRLFALPAMEEALASHSTPNQARLKVLLTLMANVDDTNILTRSDPQTLAYVQEQSRQLLLAHPVMDQEAIRLLEQMNQDFIQRNISPGGCADLLAIAIFFHRWQELIQELDLSSEKCTTTVW